MMRRNTLSEAQKSTVNNCSGLGINRTDHQTSVRDFLTEVFCSHGWAGKRFYPVLFLLLNVMLLFGFQTAVTYAEHSIDEITLTVSPSSIMTMEHFLISAKAPGAESIEIYYKDSGSTSQYRWGYNNRGDSFEMNGGYFLVPGTYLFTARAKFDGVWTEQTEPKVLTVTAPYGVLDPLDVNYSYNVIQGSKLSYSFDAVENAESYDAYYCPSSGNCSRTVSVYPGENELDVSELAPGSYYMYVRAMAKGWNYSSARNPFEIFEAGADRPAAPTVSIDENQTDFFDQDQKTILVGNPVYFKVTTPKAERIRYKITGSVNYSIIEESLDYFQYDGNAYTFSVYATSNSGNYTIYFSIMKDGEWSLFSDPVSYTLVSKGKLDKPVVSLISSEVQAGTNLPVTITVGQNVEVYFIDVYKISGNNWERMTGTSVFVEPGNETIEASLPLDGVPAGVYRLSVRACANQYEYAYNEDFDITITGSLPDAPQVSADKTYISRSESIKFTLTAPGAEKIRYQFYSDYYDEEDTTGETTVIELQGRDIYHYNRVRFSVSVNGIWSAWSEWINFTVTSVKLAAPEITVSPSTVTTGETVTLSVTPVENADRYWVDVYPLGEDGSISGNSSETHEMDYSQSSPFTLNLCSNLVPGKYRIRVFAFDFYNFYDTSDSVFADIEILESPYDAPTLSVEKEEVYVGESFELTAEAAEGETVQFIFEYFDEYGNRTYYYSEPSLQNGRAVCYTDFSSPATYTVRARTKINGVWSKYSDPVVFRVLSRGKLETPQVSIPSEIQAGTELPVTITVGENVEGYHIWLITLDGDYVTYENVRPQPGEENVTAVLSVEGRGKGSYRVSVTAYASGYEDGHIYVPFNIVGDLPAAPAVTSDKTNITSSESIKFSVTAPGAEMLRYQYYTGGSSVEVPYEDETTVVELSGIILRYQTQIRFSASFNGIWSAWSEWIYISVEFPKLDTPGLRFDKNVFTIGENVQFTIESVENADIYFYWFDHLEDGEYQWVYSGSRNKDDGLSIKLSSSSFDPGTYRVGAYAYDSTGIYNQSEYTYQYFAITESTVSGPDLIVDRTEAYIDDYEQPLVFTATANEGDGVRFFFEFSDGGSWSDYATLEDGKAELTTSMWSLGTVTVTARIVLNVEEGTLSMSSEPVTIIVKSMGKLETPTVDIPEIVSARRNLKFNVSVQSETKYVSGSLYYLSDDPDNEPPEGYDYISYKSIYTGQDDQFAYTISAGDLPAGWYRIEIYAYANKWKQSDLYTYTFKAEDTGGIPGDINGDGKINIFDLIRLRRYIVDKSVEIFANPDITGDGKENIFDLIRLRRYLVDRTIEIF